MQSYQQCMVSQGKVAVVPHCTSVLGRLVQLQSRWCNYSVTAIYWAGGPQGNQQGAPLQFSPSVLLIVISIISVLLIVIIIIIGIHQCLAHCHHHWHSSASSVSCSTSSSLAFISIITHEQGHHSWHHHHEEGREREEDRDELICNARMPLPLVLSFSRPETPPLTSTKIRQC